MSRSSSSATIATLGIDLGKNSFHLVGQDQRGAIVLRIKLSRPQLTQRLANISPCLIGMEACAGAKTPDQMDLLALHRGRARLVSQRTSVTNQIRGFLLERGVTVRQGLVPLRQALPGILGSSSDALSPRLVRLIVDLAEDWHRLDERITEVSAEIEALAAQDEHCQRLMSIPGVGPIISSAVVAAIGTGAGFKQGRDFGAWLGLVPKQESTGDRTILGKISKRGNKDLRTLFVQAAHIVLVRRPHGARLGLWPWIETAGRRLHRNMLVIALANKLARIAWAVLARGHTYQPRGAAHAA